MVLNQIHQSILKVDQSKVRRGDDPWHNAAVPVTPERESFPSGEAPGKHDGAPESSHSCEVSGHNVNACLSMNFATILLPARKRICGNHRNRRKFDGMCCQIRPVARKAHPGWHMG